MYISDASNDISIMKESLQRENLIYFHTHTHKCKVGKDFNEKKNFRHRYIEKKVHYNPLLEMHYGNQRQQYQTFSQFYLFIIYLPFSPFLPIVNSLNPFTFQ